MQKHCMLLIALICKYSSGYKQTYPLVIKEMHTDYLYHFLKSFYLFEETQANVVIP